MSTTGVQVTRKVGSMYSVFFYLSEAAAKFQKQGTLSSSSRSFSGSSVKSSVFSSNAPLFADTASRTTWPHVSEVIHRHWVNDGWMGHRALQQETTVRFPFPTDSQCCFLLTMTRDVQHSDSINHYHDYRFFSADQRTP